MKNVNLNTITDSNWGSKVTNKGKSTGYISLSSDGSILSATSTANSVGKVTFKDGVYTYTALGSDNQSIANIGDGGVSMVVVGTAGNDVFSFSANAKSVTINGGAGNDIVNAKKLDMDGAVFNMGAGNDVVSFAKGATIDLSAGNDSVYGSRGSNKITLGAGNDYVQAAADDTVIAGAGSNVIDVTNSNSRTVGTVTVTNYKYTTDVISVGSKMASMYENASVASSAFLSTGSVKADGISTVAFAEASSYWVTLQDNNKKTQTVVFAGDEEGTTISASGTTKNLIMVGNNNDSGQYLIGGSGKDTIYAGVGDSVNGGKGNDYIVLDAAHNDRIYVGIQSTGGKDTVEGFKGGFEDTSDVVYFFDGITKATATNTDDGLKVTDGKATLVLKGTTSDNGAVKILGMDSAGTVKQISVAESSGGVITATEVDEYYVGKKAAVDFSQVNDDVQIDLGNTGRWTTGSPTFSGIVAATGASNGTNRLVGAAGTKNTLQGGAGGDNSIYGGGTAADLLVGGDGAEDVFFYGTGNGKDTISGYNSSEDVVAVWGAATGGSRDSDGNVKVKWQDGQTLTLASLGTDENTTIYYSYANGASSTGLRVGQTDRANTFAYADDVSIYWGGKQGDTLQISSTDDVKAWLDGSHGVLFNGITTLDASSASGAVELAGSAKSDTILGGSGDNSLWGGAGQTNDVMTGGSGYNEFYFGMGEGKDVITQSNDGDKVMLYNVALENIASAAVNDSGAMVINLSDGSRLTIENYSSAGASTFQLTDGTYTYDKADGTWTKA